MAAIKIDLYTDNKFSIQSNYLLSRDSCEFVTFAVNYIKKYKSRKDKNGSYMNAIRHFISFEEETCQRYQTNDIGIDVLEDFNYFLENTKSLKISTAGGVTLKIKYILKKADQNGWSVDNSFYDTRLKREKPFSIALDRRDIARIYYFKGLTKKEEEMRDFFVLGCQTSLRYSDLIRLTKEHLKDNIIEIKMQKTKEDACIPVDLYVREIFEKYNYKLPKYKSLQHFNMSIKRICKKVGLIKEIAYETELNGKVIQVKKPMYELIASHTARRSFVTIRLDEGWSIDELSNCTGHRSMTCLMGYSKRDKRKMARRLSEAC